MYSKILSKFSLKKRVLLAILFQILILLAMLFTAFLPLVLGREMRVSVLPVDPRDLFRGNYVQLRYDFNNKACDIDVKNGDTVYALFNDGKDGKDEFVKLVKDRPKDVKFIKGTINNKKHNCYAKFGIEAYFLPKNKAVEAEKNITLRDNSTVVLKVFKNGKARIESLIIDGKKY
ncbi:GDYXXLXY domain-containing protein [Campylobacter geochelonis]|uniref:Phosphohistidine phosphatase SixA n=1 Tax=Campylobacter geochelonis TaxID=1780362 RepID=A0A128EJ86_9BACT|nr:GDYXXLXY domain-containing protein [Campylobacter geochelonis]QKF71277.1 GDYXXLXY domain-containing protein [Campylobacter geochelonis]CZE49019.1 phosphohistidine phosphatase SixA [Campylobacter geochelonis]